MSEWRTQKCHEGKKRRYIAKQAALTFQASANTDTGQCRTLC
jgi:hypothetical protein